MKTTLRVKNAGYPVFGPPYTFVGLPPGAPPASHSKYWRKIPSCYWHREGGKKRKTSEKCQRTLFFLTRPPLKGNWLVRV